MTDVPPWEDPRRALGRHGLAPKRSFSQNFLVSRETVEKIAEAAVDAPGRPVVELGPGLGTLTTALLRRGAKVYAVERDRDMAEVLRTDLSGVAGFELIEADAATVDLGALAARAGERVVVTGNLPYAITGSILRRLVEDRASIRHAVVMVQKEVRDRLLAPPGTKAYGALTVFVSACFAIEPVLLVRAGCFHPPPKVASAVIRLVPLVTPRAEETEAFRQIVKAAFGARRKTLRNALGSLGGGPEVAVTRLEAVGIDPSRRGETLSVEEFGALARAWAEAAIPPS